MACTMSQKHIDREDLKHVVHRRKKKKGVMFNHFYSFNNEIYHPSGGAAIGNLASEKLGKL